MPIFVDEVVISVEVEERPAAEASARAGSSKASPTEDKQALVSECVERVLDVLAQRRER